jgi:Resolvase, N terminal domain
VNTVLKPKRCGYICVSPTENADQQLQTLQKAGCQKLFTDQVKDGASKRPELERCLQALQPGDTLVIWRLDRLGCNVRDVVEIVDDLTLRRVNLFSLSDSLNTTARWGLWIRQTFKALRAVEPNRLVEPNHQPVERTEPDMMPTRAVAASASKSNKKTGHSQTALLIMAAARKQGDGWFVANDLQVTDPDSGKSLNRRSRDWVISELVAENLLEEGIPLASGKKGKPARRYRVAPLSSDASASNDLQP